MRNEVSLNNYPRIVFSIDMTSVYRPTRLKNDVEKKPDPNFVTGKYINHFIILNVYINQKKPELHSHKQAILR